MCYPHFTDKGSEDQQVWFTCLRLTWLASHRAGHQLGYSALSNPELSSIMWFFLFVSSEKKNVVSMCFLYSSYNSISFFLNTEKRRLGVLDFVRWINVFDIPENIFYSSTAWKFIPLNFSLLILTHWTFCSRWKKTLCFPNDRHWVVKEVKKDTEWIYS